MLDLKITTFHYSLLLLVFDNALKFNWSTLVLLSWLAVLLKWKIQHTEKHSQKTDDDDDDDDDGDGDNADDKRKKVDNC